MKKNNNNFEIRQAKIEDIHSIINILNQLSKTEYESKSFFILDSIIKDNNNILITLLKNNKIVGIGTLLLRQNLSHNCKPVGYIENVVIDKEYRGLGLGKNIINHLISIGYKNNCYKIILDCSKKNTHFYEKCGFKITEETNMRLDIN